MKNKSIAALMRSYLKLKGLPLRPALSFDDVQIINNISDINSRSDIKNLRTRLARNFFLNIPIVSANMDTVTDARMAIALARLGGLGFIHQFFPLEERIRQVMEVKRADNALIERPVCIGHWETLGKTKEVMKKYGISSILLTDDHNYLYGIITSRDYRFKDDDSLPVEKVMTKMPLITAHVTISRKEAENLMEKYKIEKLPIIDHDGRLVALISAKGILKEKEFPNAVRDKKGRLVVGAALRLNADYMKEAEKLLAAGADVLLLDTARAGSTRVGEAVKNIKVKFKDAILVVGNIDTPEEVEFLAEAGADCVKIGIGPGAACKTQEETGVGLPQLYAIATCVAIAKELGIYAIADGGIRNGACLSKALVAGADAVMIGSLFAGTEESPGITFRKGNQLWKHYRGSASLEHQLDRIKSGSLDEVRNPEGESGVIPYAGSVHSVIEGLLGGLRSSMSYVGARDLEEYWKSGKFIWRTNAGKEEGKPRI
ncbi:MAG: IMP dehydrogenase [Patescibacteria group bacterium]